MKTLLLSSLATLIACCLYAQSPLTENKYALGFADVFVLKVRFTERLLDEKCYCVYKNGTKCVLYKIRVSDVLYCPENTAYDSSVLMKLTYIVTPSTYTDSLNETTELLITAMPSSSPKYLAFTRLLDVKMSEGTTFYHNYAYLSGLTSCKRKKTDVFEKFIDSQ